MDTATGIDAVVNDYLRRVGAALSDLPRARSQEIVQELGEHIREAREDGVVVTEADARNLVDQLGAPGAIADEAQSRFGRRRRATVGGREIGALLLLTIGSFAIPVIGWAAGIVLLWTSEAWNRRDKIIGTLLTPGGAVLIIVVVAVASSAGASGGPGHLALLLLLVMPIATAVYLLVQLNRRAPPM